MRKCRTSAICYPRQVGTAVFTAFGICHFVIPSAFDIRASSLSHARSTTRSKRATVLKVRSTMLRFNDVGGGVAVLVAVRPAAGDGVGVDEAACSSDKGAR